MPKPIPDGYHTLTPYLVVPDGEVMLRFLQDAFAAELHERFNRLDGTLKHAELQIGDSRLMVGQANPQFTPRPQTLYVYVPDVDAAYQRALDAGAKSLMPVANQDYGDRSGGFEDTRRKLVVGRNPCRGREHPGNPAPRPGPGSRPLELVAETSDRAAPVPRLSFGAPRVLFRGRSKYSLTEYFQILQ